MSLVDFATKFPHRYIKICHTEPGGHDTDRGGRLSAAVVTGAIVWSVVEGTANVDDVARGSVTVGWLSTFCVRSGDALRGH